VALLDAHQLALRGIALECANLVISCIVEMAVGLGSTASTATSALLVSFNDAKKQRGQQFA
jgi:hypothetical protein